MSNIININDNFLIPEEEETGWEDTCFIIMWQSPKSGGTYSEMRKTRRGKDKFLKTLADFGINLETIQVSEVPKVWRPERKDDKKKNRRAKINQEKGRRALDGKLNGTPLLHSRRG